MACHECPWLRSLQYATFWLPKFPEPVLLLVTVTRYGVTLSLCMNNAYT